MAMSDNAVYLCLLLWLIESTGLRPHWHHWTTPLTRLSIRENSWRPVLIFRIALLKCVVHVCMTLFGRWRPYFMWNRGSTPVRCRFSLSLPSILQLICFKILFIRFTEIKYLSASWLGQSWQVRKSNKINVWEYSCHQSMSWLFCNFPGR